MPGRSGSLRCSYVLFDSLSPSASIVTLISPIMARHTDGSLHITDGDRTRGQLWVGIPGNAALRDAADHGRAGRAIHPGLAHLHASARPRPPRLMTRRTYIQCSHTLPPPPPAAALLRGCRLRRLLNTCDLFTRQGALSRTSDFLYYGCTVSKRSPNLRTCIGRFVNIVKTTAGPSSRGTGAGRRSLPLLPPDLLLRTLLRVARPSSILI